MSDTTPMNTRVDTPLNTPDSTAISPPKKNSSLKFKLSAALVVILAATGTAGYLAYQQGWANPYLPDILQNKTATVPIAITPNASSTDNNAPVIATPTTPADNNAAATPAPATPSTEPPAMASATPPASTEPTPLNPPTSATTPAEPVLPPSVAQTTPPTTPPNAAAPAVNTPINTALLTTMDAQLQWQGLQFDFNQRWDTSAALQQIQTLKSQLQATNSSALLPTLATLSQAETQVQAWHTLNPQANLAALQQSLTDLNTLQLRTTEVEQKTNEENGWWARILATFKKIFEIKRVDNTATPTLTAANAAIVKQSISANLMSAQWAARNGQWSVAQEQVRQADANIQKYSTGYNLSALKPLMDANNFPAPPDFNAVAQALSQARAQLAAQTSTPTNTQPTPTNNTANTGVKL